jgi:hypothetical protein
MEGFYWNNFSLVNISVEGLSIPASNLGYNIKLAFNYGTNFWLMLPTPAPTSFSFKNQNVLYGKIGGGSGVVLLIVA